MLHHYSDVLGYLDLNNAAPADLVLQDCELTVGCLTCSQEDPVQVMKHVLLNTTRLLWMEISRIKCHQKYLKCVLMSFLSLNFIRTFPMAKQRSLIVNTATANSVFLLRAQDSSIFSHAPTKQVSAH